MKKILIGAAAALALSFAPAQAAPGVNVSQTCTDNDNFGVSHGECTSILNRALNKAESDDAAAFCKAFKVTDPTNFDAFYKNLGQCVKATH